MKLAYLAATTLLACSTTDDRPETLAFITESILAPSCGTAECHSTHNHQSDDVFDTVAGAQTSLATHGLILCSDSMGNTEDPCEFGGNTYLLTVLTKTDVEGDRMPLDQPLANKDIVFIQQWITDGADGYTSLEAGSN